MESRYVLWLPPLGGCDVLWLPPFRRKPRTLGRTSRRHVRGFHNRVELPCVCTLLARTVAGFFPPAKRHVIVQPGCRQVHHDEAALCVSLEMAGVAERRGHDAAGQAERCVVGNGERLVVVLTRITDATGPKISSRLIRIPGEVSV